LGLRLEARTLLNEAESAQPNASDRAPHESKALAEATENLWRVLDALHGKANFNPTQPRVPRGNPDGGQWTDDPAHGGSWSAGNGDEREESESAGGSQLEREGSKIDPEYLLLLAGGHHYMPVSLFKKLPFRPETRKVFDKATTGPLIEPHRYSREHAIYNELMGERIVDYATRKRVRIEDMTPEHAREFLSEIRNPDDQVGRFNRKIRKLQKILRFMQRRIR
jgi:hypothetical protein